MSLLIEYLRWELSKLGEVCRELLFGIFAGVLAPYKWLYLAEHITPEERVMLSTLVLGILVAVINFVNWDYLAGKTDKIDSDNALGL